MASDDKKAKANPAPKNDAVAKKEPAPAKKDASPPKDKSAPAAEPAKPAGGEKAADPAAGYSRGEGQKPVSQAYKDNWNAIYGKKSAKKGAKKSAKKSANKKNNKKKKR